MIHLISMESEDGYPAETPYTKETLLAKAEEVAEFLTGKGYIEKVGIAGSLARGKDNPTDIDIVLFVDDSCALELQREQIDKALDMYDYSDENHVIANEFESEITKIGLEREEIGKLLLMLFNEEAELDQSQAVFYPIDWIIVPLSPSDKFIEISTILNFDPNFLGELSKDVLTYNPKTGKFEKEPYLNDHQEKILHDATTRVLKILIRDDEYMKAVKNSPGHQKRVQRVKNIKH